MSPGNATITYTVTTPCGTATASAAITVIILPNAGTVSGSSTVCAGSTTTYTSDGLSGGSWSSATPSVATVNATTGVVTGVAAGTATITYTFTNGCGTSTCNKSHHRESSCKCGYRERGPTVCIGSTTAFTSNGLSGGTWSSSNTAAATVNTTTGVVTGVAAGNATITYTSTTPCGTATASAAITVIIVPDAGTVSGASTVCVGSTTTYTSDGLSGGTWSSVTPSVATVNATTGVVTGVSAGNATITYTFTNSCGTSSCNKNNHRESSCQCGYSERGCHSLCGLNNCIYQQRPQRWHLEQQQCCSSIGQSNYRCRYRCAAGSATITYTSTTPCGTATASANITVNPVLSAGTVSGASTLCIGSTTTLYQQWLCRWKLEQCYSFSGNC